MKRYLIIIISLGILATGCRDESAQSESMEEKEEHDQDMIGLSLSEAEKLAVKRGLIYRVTMLDGKPRPATRDLRENRVNFVVEAGKVLGVSRG